MSLIQFQAETIRVPDDIIKKMQSEIDKFVWRGQRRLAADVAQQPLEKGGIGLTRLKDTINVAAVKWLVSAEEP